jgi:hypothetical protein
MLSHQGQEKTLHLKAGYIDADFPSFEAFPCIHTADHTFGKFVEALAHRVFRYRFR